jgi:gluconokinase
MVIVILGVAGAGKTTVGTALAGTLGWRFVDADDLHPPANVEKMGRGEPLTDADREPWLAAVRDVIVRALQEEDAVVIACSALKARYRAQLAGGDPRVRFVHLDVSRSLLEERLGRRRDHFATETLLDSQLATLEVPTDAVVLDGAQAPRALVEEILMKLPLR